MRNDVEMRKKGRISALLKTIAVSMVLAVSFSGIVNAYDLNGNTTVERGIEASEGNTTLNVKGDKIVVNGPVSGFSSIALGKATWGIPMLTAESFDYNGKITLGTDGFDLTFPKPETVSVGDKSPLIVSKQQTIPMDEGSFIAKAKSYSVSPIAGVTVDCYINGDVKKDQDEKKIVYEISENKASKLTFTTVEWKDKGPLIDHSTTMSNTTFAGAAVDTSNIHFKNIQSLNAGQRITLVSNFGDSVGTITGTRFKTQSGEGTGKVSLVDRDLIFTVESFDNGQNSAVNGGSAETEPVNKYTLKTDVNTQPIVFTPGGNLTTTITTTNGEGDPYDFFRNAQLNGVTLTRGRHYTIRRGSLIIELLPEALKELPEGTNYLTVFFDDGDITIPFDMATVPKGNTKDAPKTGEI